MQVMFVKLYSIVLKLTNLEVGLVVISVALLCASLTCLALMLICKKNNSNAVSVVKNKYLSLVENINGGMVLATHSLNPDETIAIYVSPVFTEMTGYTIKDIKATFDGKYLYMILDEDRAAVTAKYSEQLKAGNTYQIPYRIRKKDGSIIWVMDNGYLIASEQGLCNYSIITDITLIKDQEEELRLSENRFSIAINASSGTLFEVDLKKQMYTHFENAERIFGVNEKKLVDDTRAFALLPYKEYVTAVSDYFFHPSDRKLAISKMNEIFKEKSVSYEARLRRFDNSYIWARIDLSLIYDESNAPRFLVGYMSDINDIKKRTQLLESKAQTDPMTGLYNKVETALLIDGVLRDFPKQLHALIVLDVDNFKGINDTLGHAFGDVVLIDVAEKLKNLVDKKDVVGRIGGDEFAILIQDATDISSILKKATEISMAFRQTYSGEKIDYSISCSMGIVTSKAEEPFESLYRKADAALYQAKQNGKDQFVLYNEEAADSYPIEHARTNNEELQNLKDYHNIEVYIFELLYAAKDFDASIKMALATIGQYYHVSRVSIFENDYNNQTTNNIYEWCNEGIKPAMTNQQGIKIAYDTGSLFDLFDKNGLFYCNDISDLAEYPKHQLSSQGTLATLRLTVVNDKKTYGFIGFDDCTAHRIWTAEEVEKLSFLSKVISVFLFKRKTESTVLENLNTRLKILEVLPDYVCVVNPAKHSIEYANKKMKELIPDIQPGAYCFTNLRGGQNAPCETCLIERIRKGDTNNLEIISEDKKTRLNVNALEIFWTNDQKMVLLYGNVATKNNKKLQ